MSYKLYQQTSCGYNLEVISDAPDGGKNCRLHLPTSNGEKLIGLTYDKDGHVISIEGNDVSGYHKLDVSAWEVKKHD